MLKRALIEYHDSPEADHFGIDKTYAKVAEKLWIKNLWEKVKEYCEKCNKCNMTKVPSRTTYSEPGMMPIPKNPMDCLQIDIQGPYIRSTKGNKNIIVITDYLTRFLFSKAVKRATTKDIIRFIQKVIEENGLPLILQSDQGTPFMSRKFQEFLESYKIQHKISTSYHPKTQGLVERANETLNYRLRLLTPRSNLRTWDAYVQAATFSINNSINRITGNKPFKLMKGYNPRTKLDNYFFNIEEDFDVNTERIKAREKVEHLY